MRRDATWRKVRLAAAWGAAGVVSAAIAMPAFAAAIFENPIKAESIAGLLADLLKFFVRVATVVCVIGIVWSGFLFVKAQGNEEELKRAKRAFFYSLVGTLLMLGAEVISQAIGQSIKQISSGKSK
jgi:cytochrome bd-type quinol oxidase subunit 2